MAVGSEGVLVVVVVAWEPPIRSTVRAPLMPNRGRPTRDGEAKPAGPASPAYKQLLLGRELTLRLGASVSRPSRHIFGASLTKPLRSMHRILLGLGFVPGPPPLVVAMVMYAQGLRHAKPSPGRIGWKEDGRRGVEACEAGQEVRKSLLLTLSFLVPKPSR